MHTLHVTDPDGTPLALYVEAVDPEVWRRRHDLLQVPPKPLDRLRGSARQPYFLRVDHRRTGGRPEATAGTAR
jgi:hypothetical protein